MTERLPKNIPTAGHLAYLDGLRGLAAMQVVLGHAALQINWGTAPQSGFVHAAIWPVGFAREAVALFIVLSGFCLMLPVVRREGVLPGGAIEFFKRRARRILPPYYFAVALSLLLIWTLIGKKTHTHWDVALPADGKAIWSHLLLVQDLFHDTASRINNVMWSISVEWRIYFLFPLLVLLWRSIGPALTALTAVLSSYFLVRWLHFDWLNTGTYGLCPQFVGLFAMGMFGAGLAYSKSPQLVRLRQAAPWVALTLALFAAVVLTHQFKFRHGNTLPWYLRDYVIGMFSVSVMVLAATQPCNVVHQVLAWKPIALLGAFGYSLYLMHSPFLQLLSQYVLSPLGFGPFLSLLLLLCLGVPVVVALCYGFYLLCERPFLNTPVGPSLPARPGAVVPAPAVELQTSGRPDA